MSLPDIVATTGRLTRPFDPYNLDPYSDRVWKCGTRDANVYDHAVGRFVSFSAMCESFRCVQQTCSLYKIGLIKRFYDAIPGGLFADANTIHVQAFRSGEGKKVAGRAATAGARLVRAVVFDVTGSHKDAAWYFSDADLHRAGDSEPSYPLTPARARSFYFDVILVPGVLGARPTAQRAPEWALPREKGDEEKPKRTRVEETQPTITEHVHARAERILVESRPKGVSAKRYRTPARVAVAFEKARGIVEEQAWARRLADSR